ncbi:hypothetical protein HC928_09740 [bacterium]|nr:hypothetical protein [bacterium]
MSMFTDFGASKKYGLTRQQHACANVVEDHRIEKAMGNLFPGSLYNLQRAHEWLYNNLTNNWHKAPQFTKALVAYFDRVKYGDTVFWQDTVDVQTRALVEQCIQAVGSVDLVQGTDDAIKAGLKIYEILEPL